MKKTIVLKIGGRLIEDNIEALSGVKSLIGDGHRVVIVHGGGSQISKALKDKQVDSKFVDGYRVTNKKAIKIVESTLLGHVNKQLVDKLTAIGIKSIGLSGKDTDLMVCHKKIHPSVDLGYVGQIEGCNVKGLNYLLSYRYTPVIACLGRDMKGRTLNINADDVASELACRLKADHLFFLSDVDGFYKDANNPASLYPSLSLSDVTNLLQENKVMGGMIPKLKNIKKTLEKDVKKVTLMNGCQLACIKEVIQSNSMGTSFYKGE